MKKCKTILAACVAVLLAVLSLSGCTWQFADMSKEENDGYNSTPPAMYYEGELYDLRYMTLSEIDIEGRELELLGTAVYVGANSYEFTENFQSNYDRVQGAEVYRQSNAKTTGLLILKVGESYYEVGSGKY